MHFSLDVWNTIIVPNKTYAQKRNELIAGLLGMNESVVSSIYTSVKRRLDTKAEIFGIGLDSFNVYKELSCAFHRVNSCLSFWQIEKALSGLREDLEELFLENPPHVPDVTVSTVCELQSVGHTFSVASNTNFIRGVVIEKFLSFMGLDFKFCIFSDIECVSKPDPAFWQIVIDNAPISTRYVHIGDNSICDVPTVREMEHHIITHPDMLSNTLKEYACAKA